MLCNRQEWEAQGLRREQQCCWKWLGLIPSCKRPEFHPVRVKSISLLDSSPDGSGELFGGLGDELEAVPSVPRSGWLPRIVYIPVKKK